jgi:hypothetical protein
MGRQRKFETVEELQLAIGKYFAECKDNETPLTISGLAYAIDLTRENILVYEKDENRVEFHDTVKRAKAYILADQEARLVSGKNNPAGLIFSMKNNYGWRDTQEINHTIGDAVIVVGKPAPAIEVKDETRLRLSNEIEDE